jgi:glycosyltransferase involved in cell wall biosynthesis
MTESPTFTVFTPTFNRAHVLHRVWESLSAQSFRDFEWLVVDDGSTDGTDALVAAWTREADFPVRYLSQANSGKAAAFNRGVAAATGRLFLTLDSDDSCVATALERFHLHWESIPRVEREEFVGVTALGRTPNGAIHGTPFPRDVFDSDSIAIRFQHRVKGDKWGFSRVDVLRAFPFPTSTDSKFVSESVVWYAIARNYRTRFVNEPLWIYHIDDGGDHLSSLRYDVVAGRLGYHDYVLNEMSDWMVPGFREFMKSAVNYARYSFDLGRSVRDQLRSVRPTQSRVAASLALPAGYILARRDAPQLIARTR